MNSKVLEFFRFLFVGGAASVVYLIILIVTKEHFHFSIELSYTIAFSLAFLISLTGNTTLVFKKRLNLKLFIKFSTVYAFTYLVNLGVVSVLEYLAVGTILIGLITSLTAMVSNWSLHKFWTYKASEAVQ